MAKVGGFNTSAYDKLSQVLLEYVKSEIELYALQLPDDEEYKQDLVSIVVDRLIYSIEESIDYIVDDAIEELDFNRPKEE